MDRQRLLTSVIIAVVADLTVAIAGDSPTPTRWIASHVHALLLLPAVRLMPIMAVLALMVANGWLLGRRAVDDDAPGIARYVLFLLLGLPTALIQVGALAVIYLVLR
jgi:hypothetical protein